MMRRKNTAEAFEVLRRIHEETQAKASKGGSRAAPAQPAPSVPPARPPLAQPGAEPGGPKAEVAGPAEEVGRAKAELARRDSVSGSAPPAPRPRIARAPLLRAPPGPLLPSVRRAMPAQERPEASGFRSVLDRWFLGSRSALGAAEASADRPSEDLARTALERRELLRALAREGERGPDDGPDDDPAAPEETSVRAPWRPWRASSLRGVDPVLVEERRSAWRKAPAPVLAESVSAYSAGGGAPLGSARAETPEDAAGTPAAVVERASAPEGPEAAGEPGRARGSSARDGGPTGARTRERASGPELSSRASEDVPVRARDSWAGWLFGPTLSRFLDRTVEVRVSTLVGATLASITAVFVFLIYSGAPGRREDATYGDFPLPAEAPASETEEAGVPAARPPPVRWSGAGSEDAGAARDAGDPAPDPSRATVEILPRERPPAEVSGGASAGSAAGLALAAEEREVPPATPRPYYAIQVRARESWEGAGRLAEYFRGLGYADLDTEPEGRDAAGDALFTVFVGRYSESEEARRACERLKEETRRKPYRYGRDSFQGAFVVLRGRASR